METHSGYRHPTETADLLLAKARSDLLPEVVEALEQALTDHCGEIGGGKGCRMTWDVEDGLCKNCPYYQSNETLTTARVLLNPPSAANGQGDSADTVTNLEFKKMKPNIILLEDEDD